MDQAALELRGISKRYGAVQANDDVDLRVGRGTVHALVGENGAGKSTLMKIAYGHVHADAGEILIKGTKVTRHAPAQSIRHGLGMVHQHFMLVKPLTVVENAVLGREPTRLGGLLDLGSAARKLAELSARFGLDVDPHARIEDLSVGQQQRVEILKVLFQGCDVLILDEPTAVLTPGEVRDLFEVLRGLVADGMTIVLITHKLDEVLAIADRVSVMRRGKMIEEMDRDESLRAEDIARAMVGRPVLERVEKTPAKVGGAVLEVEELVVPGRRGVVAVQGISFAVRAGEIVGVAGVEGNGQTELVEALLGLCEIDSGTIAMRTHDVTGASVYERYSAGMAHVPEDRHDRALVLDYSVRDNLILGQQRAFSGALGLLDRKRIRSYADELVESFGVRPEDPSLQVRGLSGGNQQKVVVAREMSRQKPALLICAQPTRGVDIGAIEAIHRRMIEARDQGLAVLLVSAELNELQALSDRLLVMYKGRVVACLTADEIAADGARDRIGALMTGASDGSAAPESAAAAAEAAESGEAGAT
ncbi:ABC transporter ATP-binding protein [Haliangium ochraceum]|uniref:ABC transporter related protein n=1 Tax=Haliangium ochraceum (strain DSM 14365 / JCM 11303 / SMP-2) TaxID=502025 RepID=D0LT66_HALO1|nr:ABC transporter ATP-binding protein [Haliangium ochraceum]ACY19202.1 ABC transporter related protein [Haliangium ochraceum DSM 14365]